MKIKEMTHRVHRTDNGTRVRTTKVRIYIDLAGENILENLQKRRSRPVALYRELLGQVREAYNLGQGKIGWSQKAGCSCGCSPGFIVSDHFGYDIFVSVEA